MATVSLPKTWSTVTAETVTGTDLNGNFTAITDQVNGGLDNDNLADGYKQAVFNIVAYGAALDDATDDGPAYNLAIDAASTAGGGVVLVPSGTSYVNTTITVKSGVRVVGLSKDGCKIRVGASLANLPAVRFGDNTSVIQNAGWEYVQIANSDGVTGVTGMALYQVRFSRFVCPYVSDCDVGMQLYGGDTFGATNGIYDPHILRCTTGILFDADSGKQFNDTIIYGGTIIGWSPIVAGTKGIVISKGDTNLILGTDIEDYDVGIQLASSDSGGNRVVMARIEDCNTNYDLVSGTQHNQIIGGTGTVSDSSGNDTNMWIIDNEVKLGARNLLFATTSNGPILEDSTGSLHRITVDTSGVLSTVAYP